MTKFVRRPFNCVCLSALYTYLRYIDFIYIYFIYTYQISNHTVLNIIIIYLSYILTTQSDFD